MLEHRKNHKNIYSLKNHSIRVFSQFIIWILASNQLALQCIILLENESDVLQAIKTLVSNYKVNR